MARALMMGSFVILFAVSGLYPRDGATASAAHVRCAGICADRGGS